MRLDQFNILNQKDNNVCLRIDKILDEDLEIEQVDIKKLLEDAEDVICQYRAFINSIVNNFNLEDLITNRR